VSEDVELLCPRCRTTRRLIRDLLGGDTVFIAADVKLPDHLPNCPARKTFDFNGIKVETYMEPEP
jgi:hypothetical protein